MGKMVLLPAAGALPGCTRIASYATSQHNTGGPCSARQAVQLARCDAYRLLLLDHLLLPLQQLQLALNGLGLIAAAVHRAAQGSTDRTGRQRSAAVHGLQQCVAGTARN